MSLLFRREDRWFGDRCYSSKSAYEAFSASSVKDTIRDDILRSRAPYSGKLFMWLVLRNRCCTADNLQRRSLLTRSMPTV
jgi:hypothetical protein